MPPKISVLMPTYNDGLFLADAIESILNQTFSNFEFFIFNDGSTDNTTEILSYYAHRDNRIRIMQSKSNLGRAEARNRLIASAPTGELIAIMDSDDISMSDRFEKQVMFLDDHIDTAVLGTQVINVDEQNHPTSDQTKQPLTHGLLAWTLIYSVPFCNPSVMLRSSVIEKVGLYKFGSAVEDADYWTRAVFVGRYANLPDVLLQYRMPTQRLIKRMSDWDIPLRKVSSEFIKKITNISVKPDMISLLRKSMYQSADLNLTIEKQAEIVLLIQKIFSEMHAKGLLCEADIDELMTPMLKQIKSVVNSSYN